jgi:hypothetical protein
MDLTKTQNVMRPLEQIPQRKRWGIYLQTIAGTLGFLGAFLLPRLGFPWQASLVVAGFCGWVASKQLLLTYAKALPAFIADVVNALKGQRPPEPPATP